MRIQRIGMLAAAAAAAALALFLVAAWPVNAANAQAYWGYEASQPESAENSHSPFYMVFECPLN